MSSVRCCTNRIYYGYCYCTNPRAEAEKEYGLVWSLGSNNKKEAKVSLVKRAKKLAMKKEDKELLKAGVTSDCGELTDEGEELLMDILFKANKTKLVEIAEKLNKDSKKEKK